MEGKVCGKKSVATNFALAFDGQEVEPDVVHLLQGLVGHILELRSLQQQPGWSERIFGSEFSVLEDAAVILTGVYRSSQTQLKRTGTNERMSVS